MAATPSVKITYEVPYRGTTRTTSNRYHFNGGTPADTAHWNTLFDNVVNAFKLTQTAAVTIVQADGYAAGSDIPVATKNYSTVGTLAPAAAVPAPGDAAALIRWSTTARTSKNHPVYLFSYIHHATMNNSGDPDLIHATYKTALETYATAWISGFSDGVNTYVRAGPNGATGVSRFVDQYVHHRDFPN